MIHVHGGNEKARFSGAGRPALPQRTRRAAIGAGRARVMVDLARIGRALEAML